MNLDGDARPSQSHRRLHRCRVLRSSRVEKLVQLLTFHLLLQHVTSSVGTCDVGWTLISGSCYNVTPPMSWSNLRQVCNSLNSSVTDIRSGREEFDLNQYLRSLGIYRAWIGLNDLQHEGQWRWESGINVTYVNWGGGEPGGNTSENCGMMAENNYKHGWNDFRCNDSVNGVCKKTGPCSTGWTLRSGLCYNVTLPMSWSGVRQACGSLGGSITDIPSSTQDYDINELLRTLGLYKAWIGLFKSTNDTQWIWNSGINVSYTNWGFNEPNNKDGEEYCGETLSASETVWRDYPCNSLFPGVCKKQAYVDTTEKPTTASVNTPSTVLTTSFTMISEAASYTSTPSDYPSVDTSSSSSSTAGTCDVGWTFISGFCYNTKPPMTWNNLRRVCNSLDSSITDIRSHGEDIDVRQYLVSLGINTAWIGLNDLQNEGQWQWESGSDVTYVNWGRSEPDGHTLENCAVTNDQHGWNDYKCDVSLHGVCKKTGPCSTGWTLRGGLCYYVTQPMSWSDVRQACVSLGGSIADISSSTQDLDITAQLRTQGIDRAWIGLFKSNSDSNWMWNSGINVTYTYWDMNEPNNVDGNEYCVETRSGSEIAWRDFFCDSLFPGVCKKEAYVYTTEKPTTASVNTPSTVLTTSFTKSEAASYNSTPSYYPSVDTSSSSSSPAESTLHFERDVWFIPVITVTLVCTAVAAALGIWACRTRLRFATGCWPAAPPPSDGRPHIAAVEVPLAAQLHCASFTPDFACYTSLAFREDNCYAPLSKEKSKRAPSNEYLDSGAYVPNSEVIQK